MFLSFFVRQALRYSFGQNNRFFFHNLLILGIKKWTHQNYYLHLSFQYSIWMNSVCVWRKEMKSHKLHIFNNFGLHYEYKYASYSSVVYKCFCDWPNFYIWQWMLSTQNGVCFSMDIDSPWKKLSFEYCISVVRKKKSSKCFVYNETTIWFVCIYARTHAVTHSIFSWCWIKARA